MNLREEKGITLVSLAITIIVLTIIAGLTINIGLEIVEEVKLETLETNMLLVEAKAREYVEEADFKLGVDETKRAENLASVRQEIYITEAKLELIGASVSIPSSITESRSNIYVLTNEAMQLWGLDELELDRDEKYLIVFNENDVSVEIYNTKGYDEKYSLTEIEKIDL